MVFRLLFVQLIFANSTLITPRRRNLKTAFSLSERIKCFSLRATPEEFENAPITGNFTFVFEANSVSEITLLLWHHHL